MRRALSADPEWFAFVRVGDVLRDPGGNYRVVRMVSRRERRTPGKLLCLAFTIRRRSWTNRCETTYFAADLKTMRWQYVGARIALRTELDQRIASEMQHHRVPPSLTADDVRGVA